MFSENCTLGEYIDNDGKCQPCAIGRYQDMKWQNACKECVPAESSTADTGSTSLANCSGKFCKVFPTLFSKRLSIQNHIF